MLELLPYPTIAPISECPEIVGLFCYVIEAYEPGVAVVIERMNDPAISIGDWSGNHLPPTNELLSNTVPLLLKMMQHIALNQAEFFISSDGTLVDVQLSINKFIGPGMLRDVFKSTIKTQIVDSIVTVDQTKIDELRGKNFILKPSKYRHYMRGDIILPLYARI